MKSEQVQKKYNDYILPYINSVRKYIPYTENEILNKMASGQLAEVYWEIKLIHYLLQNKCDILNKNSTDGPDITLNYDETKINIECRVLNQSNPTEMKKYDLPFNEERWKNYIKEPDGIIQWITNAEDIGYLKAKWLNAINEKTAQFNRWQAAETIGIDDINIIAITYSQSFISNNAYAPLSDAAAFCFGAQDRAVCRENQSHCVEYEINRIFNRQQNTGTNIELDQAVFINQKIKNITGVLFVPHPTNIGCLSNDMDGAEFYFVKNPYAKKDICGEILQNILGGIQIESVDLKDSFIKTELKIDAELQQKKDEYKLRKEELYAKLKLNANRDEYISGIKELMEDFSII